MQPLFWFNVGPGLLAFQVCCKKATLSFRPSLFDSPLSGAQPNRTYVQSSTLLFKRLRAVPHLGGLVVLASSAEVTRAINFTDWQYQNLTPRALVIFYSKLYSKDVNQNNNNKNN